jgi:hypothetical protein
MHKRTLGSVLGNSWLVSLSPMIAIRGLRSGCQNQSCKPEELEYLEYHIGI